MKLNQLKEREIVGIIEDIPKNIYLKNHKLQSSELSSITYDQLTRSFFNLSQSTASNDGVELVACLQSLIAMA